MNHFQKYPNASTDLLVSGVKVHLQTAAAK